MGLGSACEDKPTECGTFLSVGGLASPTVWLQEIQLTSPPPLATNWTMLTVTWDDVFNYLLFFVNGCPRVGFGSLERNFSSTLALTLGGKPRDTGPEIGRAVQQECRDRSRMPSSA
eukprot:TRINITY_DN5705_c1_g1_i1.p1 TRINITY_DN5705_c1_g1~~TRINITY_DN5705_c1_g1_i1.p1  ORF type:complete len:116 (-),score=13.00 TRINITY_DN5705_c1_g1_i1:11-358(-)